jgi:selenide,water dikinase
MDASWQAILTDPQTSGGLLVACDPQELPAVQAIFERLGFTQASVIGRMVAGSGEVQIE